MNNIESKGKRCDCMDKMEPYVGMPLPNLSCENKSVCSAVDSCPLAMAYVPMQRWCNTYEPAEGWHRGTIFPDLDLPFLGGGGC